MGRLPLTTGKERGMASTPKMEYQVFLCILKEMGKFLWEGREKGLPGWLSQFSKTKLRQRNFPISFKPKVAIAELFWKMQRKAWYSILGVDAMSLSLKNLLLNNHRTAEDMIERKMSNIWLNTF